MTEIGLRLPQETIDQIKGIVEYWCINRHDTGAFYRRDMYRWVAMMNDRTRHLIRTVRYYDPEWWRDYGRLAEKAELTLEGTEYPEGRSMISDYQIQDPTFYNGLVELCVNAVTQTTEGARLIADGVNRTDL